MFARLRPMVVMLTVLLLLAGCGRGTTAVPSSPAPATQSADGPIELPTDSAPLPDDPGAVDPFALLSLESMFGYMEDLTAIQPYSGWRNSGTEGEVEALDYVTAQMDEFAYLQELGLELERQTFSVFMTTELWDAGLVLTVDGQQVDVPASGLRGPRDELDLVLRFDSDGAFNDDQRDPAVAEGAVIVLHTPTEINRISADDVQGRVVLLDYAAVDRVIQGRDAAVGYATTLLNKGPAALVLVTQFSNVQRESHGAFVGDNSALNWVEGAPVVPLIYVRLEDLAPAGIAGWDDLERVEAAEVTWDADVFAPGSSQNLIARIPGQDSSQAVILGAHIDSPNCPGAMDDGSGSVILLEIARVLDAAQLQPPVDLYLTWFGSEETGLYGSAHFAATHQELLDRTLAMLQIDDLSRPLDGIEAEVNIVTWSYTAHGNADLTWPAYLYRAAARRGIVTVSTDAPYPYSDNSCLAGFDVPNADVIYENAAQMDAIGGFHYAGHIHDPYDTVELAHDVEDVLLQMAEVTLIAALETGRDQPDLRVAPAPDRRAVFVASHSEAVQMSPTTFVDMAMALSWAGFDVDMIPYGQPVTAADLADADMVIALPVLDYPSPAADVTIYDEAWTDEEVAVLEDYVAGGGFLVLTNSAIRVKFYPWDENEDWSDANLLAEPFGITFEQGPLNAGQASSQRNHPLVDGLTTIALFGGAVPFTMESGEVLASVGTEPVVALVEYGDAGGEVLVLGDVAILATGYEPENLAFWQNLAEYGRR